MLESKSMFAKRIKKPICWVSMYCKRGILPTNERGMIIVERALDILNNNKKHKVALVPVTVLVRPGQKHKIKRMAKILSES